MIPFKLQYVCILFTARDGIVNRTACFSFDRDCCFTTNDIKVKNCVKYFVYYLSRQRTREVQSRYCASPVGKLYTYSLFK